jgi:hypothetical protein
MPGKVRVWLLFAVITYFNNQSQLIKEINSFLDIVDEV